MINLIDGQRLLKEKKFDKSLKIFLYLEKKNCSDPRIFFYLGLIYFDLNQFDKSISYYITLTKKLDWKGDLSLKNNQNN